MTTPRSRLPRGLGLSLLALALALSWSPTAVAAEDVPTFADRPARDVEDVDRTFAVLLDPLAIAAGVYGGDVDLVLGRHFAASVEGDVYLLPTGTATAVGAGLLFYPGSTFHGFYVHPRAVYARPLSEGIAHFDARTDAVGLGGSAGWQWTWDYGFTARLGAGAMAFLGGAGPASGTVQLGGPQLILDGCIGWAF
jgi:hypothetical protein